MINVRQMKKNKDGAHFVNYTLDQVEIEYSCPVALPSLSKHEEDPINDSLCGL